MVMLQTSPRPKYNSVPSVLFLKLAKVSNLDSEIIKEALAVKYSQLTQANKHILVLQQVASIQASGNSPCHCHNNVNTIPAILWSLENNTAQVSSLTAAQSTKSSAVSTQIEPFTLAFSDARPQTTNCF